MTQKIDAYGNTLTGLALSPDKSTRAIFTPDVLLDWQELEDRYEHDALSARVIDRLPDDGTREEFSITGEDTTFDFASIQSELEDLDARNQLGDAWRWARLFRGSLLVMNINDGGKKEEPLNLEAATALRSLHVIEARHVVPDVFGSGLGSRSFARPEFYEIVVPHATSNNHRRIHRSRVIRFDGVKVPPSRMIENGGWGPSVLDRVNTPLSQLGEVMGYARGIMHDISTELLKIEGFREASCGTAQDKAELEKAIESIRMLKDNFHMTVLDTKDDLVERTRTVSGLHELLGDFVDAAVRATDMPRTVLLGEQPGGLNASGDSEIRTWYDFVASKQPQVLTPPLNRLLTVLFAIRANKGEAVPTEWTVEYAPLWQASEQDLVATEKLRAETESIRLADGTITVEEIRTNLVSRGILPEDAETELEEPDEDDGEELEALKAQMAELQAPPLQAVPEELDEEDDGES